MCAVSKAASKDRNRHPCAASTSLSLLTRKVDKKRVGGVPKISALEPSSIIVEVPAGARGATTDGAGGAL